MSIYNFGAGKIIRNEEKKHLPKSDPWDNIWKIVHIDKEKKDLLVNIQNDLVKFKVDIQNAVKEFISTKDKLLNISRDVSTVIYDNIFPIFQYKKTLGIISWINEVDFFLHNR